jgi:oligopeptide transport system permease protein
MKLWAELMRTCLSWLLIVGLVILLLLYPSDIVFKADGYDVVPEYQGSWEEYQHNIQSFLARLQTGDWGTDRYGQGVDEAFSFYFSRSLLVIALALLVAIPLGIGKGIFDFRHSNRVTQLLGNGTTWLVQSLPDFFVIISIQWGLLALFRWGFPQFSVFLGDQWYSFILPGFLLSLLPAAYLARITSAALADQEKKWHILFARAKGVGERMLLYRHLLRNCWPTILSHNTSLMILLLSNLIVVEYVTFYRGAAYRFFEAAGFPTVLSRNVFYPGSAIIRETDLMIAFFAGFMFLILVFQIISLIIRYRLDPAWRDES